MIDRGSEGTRAGWLLATAGAGTGTVDWNEGGRAAVSCPGMSRAVVV